MKTTNKNIYGTTETQFAFPPIYQYDKTIFLCDRNGHAEKFVNNITNNKEQTILKYSTRKSGIMPEHHKFASAFKFNFDEIPRLLFSEIRRSSRIFLCVNDTQEAQRIAQDPSLHILKTAMATCSRRMPRWGREPEFALLVVQDKCANCGSIQESMTAFDRVIFVSRQKSKKHGDCLQRCLSRNDFIRSEIFAERLEAILPAIQSESTGNPVDEIKHIILNALHNYPSRISVDDVINSACPPSEKEDPSRINNIHLALEALDKTCTFRLFEKTNTIMKDYGAYRAAATAIWSAIINTEDDLIFGAQTCAKISRITVDDIYDKLSDDKRHNNVVKAAISDTLDEMNSVDILRWYPQKGICLVPSTMTNFFACEDIFKYANPNATWSSIVIRKGNDDDYWLGVAYPKHKTRFVLNYRNGLIGFDLGKRSTVIEFDAFINRKKLGSKEATGDAPIITDFARAWGVMCGIFHLLSDVRKIPDAINVTGIAINDVRDVVYDIDITGRPVTRLRREARNYLAAFSAALAVSLLRAGSALHRLF